MRPGCDGLARDRVAWGRLRYGVGSFLLVLTTTIRPASLPNVAGVVACDAAKAGSAGASSGPVQCGAESGEMPAKAQTMKTTTIEVRFRTTSAEEDTAEFDSLEAALAACRDGETVTVVAYRPGEGSPFWAAVETFREATA